MGMFDFVSVGVPLPDGYHGRGLQTKDFDCVMTTVEITPDGKLRIEDFEYEEVPKEERKYPDDDGVLGMMGSLRKVNKKWRDLNFHGVFNFYGFESGVEDWHEYDAKFTDGKLVEIKAVEEKVT